MLLRCKTKHMAGQSVLCNGTLYGINQLGVADVINEVDAAKLLTMPVWSKYVPQEGEKIPPPPKRPSAKPEPPFQPAPPVGPQAAPVATDTVADTGSEPAEAGDQGKDPKDLKDPENYQDTSPESEDPTEGPACEAGEEPTEETASEDPAPGSEWPDPVEGMSKLYLQEMADAYEVPYEEKTTKKQLVVLIKAKMYE